MKKLSDFLSVVIVLMFMAGCSGDDDRIMSNTPSLTKQQLQGTWKVSYFKNQVDKTSDYLGYRFIFDNVDDVEAELEELNVDGLYDLFEDEIENETYTIINVSFDETSESSSVNDKLRELTEQWIVRKVLNNATKIELEERISNNPPEILHLTKI